MLNGMTPEQRQLMEFDRVNGLKSTFYLGRRVLGYQFDPQPHREICSFIDDESKKSKLLLAPRGCFKTSLISQAYVTRKIIKNPNIRVLLDSVALNNSQNNLKVVRRFFESNQKLKELYGDFTGSNLTWNDTEFVVSRRTDIKLKEATVTASGIDKIQIGPHYDLIVADDLHNRDNCRSVEQVEKVKEHMRLIFGLLDPGGEFIIGGHRWSYTDAFSMVMGDTQKPEELEFAKLFEGNKLIRGAHYPDGRLYFPRVHTREHLARQRTALGVELYSAMLENEPVLAGEGQKFSQRYFKRYLELPPDMNWYLTIDPGGRNKGNDDWVIFEGAIDSSGNRYFVRYIKKTIAKISVVGDMVYAWWKQAKKEAEDRGKGIPAGPRKRYVKIGFEVTGQQGTICQAIKDYIFGTYGEQLPFVELTHSRESKAERIEILQPYYEAGRIYHSEQMAETFGFEDQLRKYPKGHDDIADAAATQIEISSAPKKKIEEKPPGNLDEMIQRRIEDRFSEKNKIRRIHPTLGSDI